MRLYSVTLDSTLLPSLPRETITNINRGDPRTRILFHRNKFKRVLLSYLSFPSKRIHARVVLSSKNITGTTNIFSYFLTQNTISYPNLSSIKYSIYNKINDMILNSKLKLSLMLYNIFEYLIMLNLTVLENSLLFI